jgi:hypothetical protein
VTLTPHPLLVLRSKKQSRAIPLLFLKGFMACKRGETQFISIYSITQREEINKI